MDVVLGADPPTSHVPRVQVGPTLGGVVVRPPPPTTTAPMAETSARGGGGGGVALLAAPLVADQLEEREVTVGGRRQTSVGCSSIRENSRSLWPDHLSAMLFKAKWLPNLLPSKKLSATKAKDPRGSSKARLRPAFEGSFPLRSPLLVLEGNAR